jgi:hypothetical protein
VPTYWPTDQNILPNLVDFCIAKGISADDVLARSCFELSLDHTPVLITLSFKTFLHTPHPSLGNKKTNWEIFRLLLSDHLDLNVPLKIPSNIEAAINTFTNLIQWAGWTSTPEPSKAVKPPSSVLYSSSKNYLRRRLRRIWLRFHSPHIKR